MIAASSAKANFDLKQPVRAPKESELRLFREPWVPALLVFETWHGDRTCTRSRDPPRAARILVLPSMLLRMGAT